jgi:hypothetical protein
VPGDVDQAVFSGKEVTRVEARSLREIRFARSLDEHGVKTEARDEDRAHCLAIVRGEPEGAGLETERTGVCRRVPAAKLRAECALGVPVLDGGYRLLPAPGHAYPREREYADGDQSERESSGCG